MIGTPGHNATVNWIKDTIAQFPDYYTYYLESFDLSLGVSANLTNNGTPMEAFAVGLSPAGHVSGPLVYVPNLGCESVSFKVELKFGVWLTQWARPTSLLLRQAP